jgi:hypothetical protein
MTLHTAFYTFSSTSLSWLTESRSRTRPIINRSPEISRTWSILRALPTYHCQPPTRREPSNLPGFNQITNPTVLRFRQPSTLSQHTTMLWLIQQRRQRDVPPTTQPCPVGKFERIDPLVKRMHELRPLSNRLLIVSSSSCGN